MPPLSEKLRPETLSSVFGQSDAVAFLQKVIDRKNPLSLLFVGPPGCGKTTLARIYAQSFGMQPLSLSACFNSAADLKKVLKEGEKTPLFNRQIMVFVDEIHRFNRSQQDLFLPFLEEGSLILIGATTENPSFALNNALLSRLRVLKLEPLNFSSLNDILERVEKELKLSPLPEKARNELIEAAAGDARHLLNLIENLQGGLPLQKKPALYDKGQEGHYNLISALHKSLRGSDPNAALYYLCRMLNAGEEPLYIGRRLIRMATEDIGLADPGALQVALNAFQAYQILGSPEGELALAEAVIYLALAPKSASLYAGFKKAQDLAEKSAHLDPPRSILNAPSALMKEWGYAKGYQYDHDTPNGFSGAHFFPDGLQSPIFYEPVERGFEREMKKRIEYFKRLRQLNL